MATIDPQQHLKRKRRWLVPAVLGTIVLVSGIGCLLFWPSSLSLESVRAIYERLDKRTTKDDLVNLLGRPSLGHIDGESTCYIWQFTRQSFNSVEILNIAMLKGRLGDPPIITTGEDTVTGGEAWDFCLRLLKRRLGWK